MLMVSLCTGCLKVWRNLMLFLWNKRTEAWLLCKELLAYSTWPLSAHLAVIRHMCVRSRLGADGEVCVVSPSDSTISCFRRPSQSQFVFSSRKWWDQDFSHFQALLADRYHTVTVQVRCGVKVLKFLPNLKMFLETNNMSTGIYPWNKVFSPLTLSAVNIVYVLF